MNDDQRHIHELDVKSLDAYVNSLDAYVNRLLEYSALASVSERIKLLHQSVEMLRGAPLPNDQNRLREMASLREKLEAEYRQALKVGVGHSAKERSKSTEKNVRLSKPPGHRLVGLSEFLFTRKFHQQVISQVIADEREEYYGALKNGRTRKAQWIRIRCVVPVAIAVLAAIPSAMLSKLKSLAQ